MRKGKVLISIIIVCLIVGSVLVGMIKLNHNESVNPQMDATNDAELDKENDESREISTPGKDIAQQEYSQAITLQVQGEAYSLTAEDAEKIAAILDVNNMTNAGDNGSSESFCPYEVIIGNTYYGITEDATRIEALSIQANGEYSSYTKQTTEEERTILKKIMSNYE